MDAPKDRGGRTEEMVGVKQESFRQQQHTFGKFTHC